MAAQVREGGALGKGRPDKGLAYTKRFFGVCKPDLGQTMGQNHSLEEMDVLALELARLKESPAYQVGDPDISDQIMFHLAHQKQGSERYRTGSLYRRWKGAVAALLAKGPNEVTTGDFLRSEVVRQLPKFLEAVGHRHRASMERFYTSLVHQVGMHIMDPHRQQVMLAVGPRRIAHSPRPKSVKAVHPLLRDYMDELMLNGIVSLKNVRLMCSRFLQWLSTLPAFAGQEPNHLDLTRIPSDLVQGYRGYLLRLVADGSRKESTVRIHVQCLRGWFRFLYAEGHVPADLSRDLPPVEESKSVWCRRLTPEECTGLLNAVVRLSDNPVRDVVLFGALMLGTGCRPCEALRLTGRSFKRARERLYVHYVGKGRSRTVVLPPVSQQLVELYMTGHAIAGDAPLFLGVTYDVLRDRFSRYREAAGISAKVGGPHVLRHTWATLAAEGADIRWMQEYLGHSDLCYTQRYIHPDPDLMRAQVQLLPRLGSKRNDRRVG